MHINIAYQKNRLDGNVHPLIRAFADGRSDKVKETNSEADSIYCIFGNEDTTVENIFVAPISTSNITSTR